MDRKTAKSAFITSLPVLMGYSTMGAAFGILLGQSGFGPAWALLMSVTIFSGSLQFAAVDILRSAPPLIEVALLSLLVNIRYCVYGISLIEKFRRYGLAEVLPHLRPDRRNLRPAGPRPGAPRHRTARLHARSLFLRPPLLDLRQRRRRHRRNPAHLQHPRDRLHHDRALSG